MKFGIIRACFIFLFGGISKLWTSAILPFQILAVYGAIRGLWMDPFGSWGKFRLSFWTGLTGLLLSGVGIYLALPYGKTGVALVVLVTVGATNIANLYVVSRSLEIWLRGVRNAAPYFLTAAAATAVAAGARYGFSRTIRQQKELLALVSLTTLFGLYGAVFYKQLRSHLSLMMSKQTVRLSDGV